METMQEVRSNQIQKIKLMKREKHSLSHPQAQNTFKSTELNLVYSQKKKKKKKEEKIWKQNKKKQVLSLAVNKFVQPFSLYNRMK